MNQVLPNFGICCRELRGLKVASFRACVRSFCSIAGAVFSPEMEKDSGADPDRCNRCKCIGQFHMIDYLEVCAAEFLLDSKHSRSFEMPPSFWCNCS